MPPKINSRHEFTRAFEDPRTGKLMLSDRAPYRFKDFSDNIAHIVGRGDFLWTLAGRYFAGLTDRPAGLWWIIADFQPVPIIDPTLELEEGTTIYVPSRRTVQEEIFNPRRRDLH